MAINPIPSGRTAAVDANGVLNVLVKQVYDNQPTEDASGLHLEEAYKGPYDKIKGLLSHISTGETITAISSTLGTQIGISKNFDAPACPTRAGVANQWICTKIRAEEAESGDHGFLYLSYEGRPTSENDLNDDPYQDVWQLTWQAYSVDPYNFLKNDGSPEPYPCSPSFDTDPDNALPPSVPYWQDVGSRAHIDKYLNGIGENKTVQNEHYYYYAPDAGANDYRLFLNGAEGAVLQKKLLGRSATYHYPVLVHQTVKKGTSIETSYADDVGGEIDHIVTDLSGCPYTFPANEWTFVKIGDDMTQVKTREGVVFTRRQTYAGFTAVDENFYGEYVNGSSFVHNKQNITEGRWELESL